jgi:hypothetical protein
MRYPEAAIGGWRQRVESTSSLTAVTTRPKPVDDRTEMTAAKRPLAA